MTLTTTTRIEVSGYGCDNTLSAFDLSALLTRVLSGVWGEVGTVVVDRFGRVGVDVSRWCEPLTLEYLTNCGFDVS